MLCCRYGHPLPTTLFPLFWFTPFAAHGVLVELLARSRVYNNFVAESFLF
jgi:hypothetical protein